MRDEHVVYRPILQEPGRTKFPKDHLEMGLRHSERLPHILSRVLGPQHITKNLHVLDAFLQLEILDKYSRRNILFPRRQFQCREELEKGTEERGGRALLGYEVIRLHQSSPVAASSRCRRRTTHPRYACWSTSRTPHCTSRDAP